MRIYHSGSIPHPNVVAGFRRSVCIEELHYEPDGRMKRIVQTTGGLDAVPTD